MFDRAALRSAIRDLIIQVDYDISKEYDDPEEDTDGWDDLVEVFERAYARDLTSRPDVR